MADDYQFGFFRDISLVQTNGLNCISTFLASDPLAIARGQVDGIEVFEKYGRNPDIDTATTPEDIWGGGGMYTGFPLTDVETLEIFSSDVNDTGTGSGARTVRVQFLLDGDKNRCDDVVVTLNGTTPVSLGSQTYSRCARAFVVTAGSGVINAGDITIRHSVTTANIFAHLPAGFGQTQILAFTVPRAFELYLTTEIVQMTKFAGVAGSADITLRHRADGEVFRAIKHFSITDTQSFTFRNNGIAFIDEMTDIKITVESVSSNNTEVTGEMDGYLIDKTK